MTHEPGGRSPRPDPTFDRTPTDGGPLTVVRGTAHLLALVPHLFGYHPDHSLALITTRREAETGTVIRGALAFSLRMDLPVTQDLVHLPGALVPRLRQALREEDSPVVLHAFCYDPPETQGEACPVFVDELCAALSRLADEAGMLLNDVVLVRDYGRHHRPVLAAEERVDRPWVDTPTAADVPAAADMVLRGRAPLPSREDIVALVRRRDEDASAATDLALSVLALDPGRLDDDEALRALGDWVVGGGPAPSARQRAWIAVLLQDRTLRDAVLARWLPDSFSLEEVLPAPEAALLEERLPALPPGDAAGAALVRLLELAGQVPVALGAPLLTIAGCTAWERGEGTVATEACELALEVEPGYRMAVLLRQVLEGGVRPPLRPRTSTGTTSRRRRRRGRQGRAA